MEVLETKEQAASEKERKAAEAETMKEMASKLREAQERVDERHRDDAKDGGQEERTEADVDAHVDANPPLKAVRERTKPVDASSVDDRRGRTVSVTDEEKAAFFESIVSGDRYRASEALFGGRLKVVFRSRSAIESEAVDSFIRRRVASGGIATNQQYADAMRFALLAACVEELNGERFPTLTEAGEDRIGMFYHDTKEGLKEPKWLWLYDKWRDRPESVVAVVIEAFFDFEAKYWLMIGNAKTENFWNAGGSTGG